MALHTFRILGEKPVDYEPLAASRVAAVRINKRSYVVAKLDHGGYSGQWLVAITPDTLLKEQASELMNGKPFIGIDGITYIIQK